MNFHFLLDIIFPKRCVGCGKVGEYFCFRCRTTVKSIDPARGAICPVCEKSSINGLTHPRCHTPWGIDGLTSFFRYDGVVKKAVKAIKYRKVSDMCEEYVSMVPQESLEEGVQSAITSHNYNQQGRSKSLLLGQYILIPVPLHPSRLRKRGFNQAELLGALVSTGLNLPMRRDILRRDRKTTPQVEVKDRKARLKNMTDVFAVDKIVLKHYFVKMSVINVLLFDDVFTTGATMRSAAAVLKRAGVKWVWGVTMAR